ncbi:MAG: alpha/beta fold hydrolase, partial [Syntrophales bacterium]|nr:alpha/beta fold hydrolase [Syntrophales bacterium]
MYNVAAKFVALVMDQCTKAAMLPWEIMANKMEDRLRFTNDVLRTDKAKELVRTGVENVLSPPVKYGFSDYANPALIPLNLLTGGIRNFNKGMDVLIYIKDTAASAPAKLIDKICEERDRPVRFAEVVCRDVPEPAWASNNEVIHIPELEGVILRYFPAPESRKMDSMPTLLGPPMAGHGSQIVDFKRGQSLVETAHRAGVHSVFVLDWQSATKSRSHETIDDYIIKTKRCVDVMRDKFYEGKKIPVNFYGFCQNGWQMTMYAAKFPEDVHALVTAGAPIDPQAGNSDIKMFCSMFPPAFFRSLINKDGVLDGRYLVYGFIMLDPVGRVKDFVDLSHFVHDRKKVERFEHFSNWYHHNVIMIPGAFYAQTVEDHFIGSKLVRGEMIILGEKLDLRKIGPHKGHLVVTIGGTADNITDAVDNHCLAEYVSGGGGTGIKSGPDGRYLAHNEDEIRAILNEIGEKIPQFNAEEGHLGLFISGKTLKAI